MVDSTLMSGTYPSKSKPFNVVYFSCKRGLIFLCHLFDMNGWVKVHLDLSKVLNRFFEYCKSFAGKVARVRSELRIVISCFRSDIP